MIPVSIITGFLGSGKTTLLRRLLADPRMGLTAVLINEFGEVGIDHLLVRKIDENVVLLNSGCLCCGLRDDLVETLDELHARRQAGELPDFMRVVVETTGLADPAPIIHTLLTNARIAPAYRLRGLVATVDATLGERQLDDHPEAVKQAALADRVVITKTDLAAPGALIRLRERLRALVPAAATFDATLHSGPGPDELFDAGADGLEGAIDDLRRDLHRGMDRSAAGHHDDATHGHGSRIGTFCLTADTPLDWARFTQWLALLLANRGEQLLRVKGILNVAGRARPVVIHGVQHVFYPPTELERWPDADRRSRIVFITRDLPGGAIERAFQKVIAPTPGPAGAGTRPTG